ncbi:MAG TPA: hypothetical protein VI750_09665, partial [Pyrinomonadaceae bacterium]|nr:hypothetical protein [Pyrinomonadaceae bacterium]
MTICPCCGVKFNGDFNKGCISCGARSVGEPLPLPENQLPSYTRALLLVLTGTLLVLAFIAQTVMALIQRLPESLNLWSWILAIEMAGETAAWRFKWVAIPLTLLVLFAGRKTYRSMLQQPSLHCGLVYARRGLAASAAVCLLIAGLIGVSVPTRLRNRKLAIEAGDHARGYRVHRALVEYRHRLGTYPSDVNDLLKECPDEDGTLAEALSNLDSTSYKTTADLAAVPQKKPGALQGVVIRSASLNTGIDDSPTGTISFTNYEVRLAGVDKISGTEDDLIVRDGLITR